jgi:hypothetical protein
MTLKIAPVPAGGPRGGERARAGPHGSSEGDAVKAGY